MYRKMKKIVIYTAVILILIIITGVVVVGKSIVHVQLPHGAMLHILPGPKNYLSRGAVILCPGGGYRYLEKWNEGYWWFPFFYRQGFTVALLEYRMPNHDHQIPITDGAEAVQLMRAHATEWGYSRNRVGVMGFSAGGHLASTLMVSDRDSIRPDFGILFYPVISMKKELTHQGTHDHLLGEDVSEALENQYSNELHISDHTPPVYIAVSSDDQKVNPQNAISFYDGMRVKGRPATLHVYPSGGHGWVYQLSFPYHNQMLDELSKWLKNR